MKCKYWEVNYINCEGDHKWTNIKTPDTWGEDEINDAMCCRGGMGDDAVVLTSVEEIDPVDCGSDFT